MFDQGTCSMLELATKYSETIAHMLIIMVIMYAWVNWEAFWEDRLMMESSWVIGEPFRMLWMQWRSPDRLATRIREIYNENPWQPVIAGVVMVMLGSFIMSYTLYLFYTMNCIPFADMTIANIIIGIHHGVSITYFLDLLRRRRCGVIHVHTLVWHTINSIVWVIVLQTDLLSSTAGLLTFNIYVATVGLALAESWYMWMWCPAHSYLGDILGDSFHIVLVIMSSIGFGTAGDVWAPHVTTGEQIGVFVCALLYGIGFWVIRVRVLRRIAKTKWV